MIENLELTSMPLVRNLSGLNTDVKPTKNIGTGSRFFEINTGDVYVYSALNVNPITNNGWWKIPGVTYKIDESDIVLVNTDTINDTTKVPSSAVTYALGQEIDTLNNNFEYKTYTPFAGCTHICRGNVATIQVAGAITAENGQQTTIGSVTQWFPKQDMYGIAAVNGGSSGKFCLVTVGTGGNIIVYNYTGVKANYLYFTITYVF